MFKNFWYVVEWSSAVSPKPMQARLLGQDLVLYRDDSGAVIAMSDVCIHRGASLSGGWIQDGCLVCPYHGWRYDSTGRCVRIPSSGDAGPIPKKARVDAYDTQERYGWVWVFMGDLPGEQRPPIPDFGPEFFDASFAEVTGEWNWNANYERIMENGTDVTHVNWVHSFATRDEPEVRDLVLEEADWSCEATLTLRPPLRRRRGILGRLDRKLYQAPDNVTTTAWYLPAMAMIHVRLPGLGDQFIYDANIPIDETTTRTLWIARRNFFTRKAFNKSSKKRIDRIFEQDTVIVENQKPELVPHDLAAELHHKTDAVSVAYRKRRDVLREKGWEIDLRAEASDAGRMASVISSPARTAPSATNAFVMGETSTIEPSNEQVGEDARTSRERDGGAV